MAASRSVLEALLARVQKRAQEPRAAAVHIPPLPVPAVGEQDAEATHDSADTLPPQGVAPPLRAVPAASEGPARAQPPAYPSAAPAEAADADDEDIEEYDEELIEIIDDADVIPQAAAAARAIEPSAFGANLERRGSPNGKSTGAPPALPPRAPTPAPPAGAAAPGSAASVGPAPGGEPLRPEAVAARPVALASPVVHTRGVRRELRATPFIELLDASLKLGS